jgi:hypothetical protein
MIVCSHLNPFHMVSLLCRLMCVAAVLRLRSTHNAAVLSHAHPGQATGCFLGTSAACGGDCAAVWFAYM